MVRDSLLDNAKGSLEDDVQTRKKVCESRVILSVEFQAVDVESGKHES